MFVVGLDLEGVLLLFVVDMFSGSVYVPTRVDVSVQPKHECVYVYIYINTCMSTHPRSLQMITAQHAFRPLRGGQVVGEEPSEGGDEVGGHAGELHDVGDQHLSRGGKGRLSLGGSGGGLMGVCISLNKSQGLYAFVLVGGCM